MGRPQGKSLNPRALRDLLRLHGMTQSALAERCDLSPSGLSQLVHGTSRASGRVVQALALALECDPGTLFPECTRFEAKLDEAPKGALGERAGAA